MRMKNLRKVTLQIRRTQRKIRRIFPRAMPIRTNTQAIKIRKNLARRAKNSTSTKVRNKKRRRRQRKKGRVI